MKKFIEKDTSTMSKQLIAHCGINCATCRNFFRSPKGHCPGCRVAGEGQPEHCFKCRIKSCVREHEVSICAYCHEFPCKFIKDIDRRYRKSYNLSLIENLNTILKVGLDAFVTQEKSKWTCNTCGCTLSVHDKSCLFCGSEKNL